MCLHIYGGSADIIHYIPIGKVVVGVIETLIINSLVLAIIEEEEVFVFSFSNCHNCSMITNMKSWTDDHWLLLESNLTVRQPRRMPIMFYSSFNKRRLIANEGLVNHTGIREDSGVNLVWNLGVMDPGKKNSIFPGKFPKSFDFFRQFKKKFYFSRQISEKFQFFSGNLKNFFDFPGKNWPFTATGGQIILFLFKVTTFKHISCTS